MTSDKSDYAKMDDRALVAWYKRLCETCGEGSPLRVKDVTDLVTVEKELNKRGLIKPVDVSG